MIPIIKKILYATDLSKNSAHALRYALYLARQDKGRIFIIHVIEEVPPHIQAFLGGYVDARHLDEFAAGAVEQIKKRLALFYERELKDEPEL
ncbi:MAG: universal stress protein, partial [Syntrophales bacterium]|nr:universal stress protein [Syntrophales bacterium]